MYCLLSIHVCACAHMYVPSCGGQSLILSIASGCFHPCFLRLNLELANSSNWLAGVPQGSFPGVHHTGIVMCTRSYLNHLHRPSHSSQGRSQTLKSRYVLPWLLICKCLIMYTDRYTREIELAISALQCTCCKAGIWPNI